MKVASFTCDGRSSYGLVIDGRIREASPGLRSQCADLRSLLASGRLDELRLDVGGEEFDAADVQYVPTIPNPDKILCVGVNYRAHIEEMGRQVPDYPVVFVRFPGSLVGHGAPILRPTVSEQFDFEGELAIIIGRPARHVKKETASDHIAGYCCFMDGSVRDWQRHTAQFTPGKNFQHSGAMGPWLVTAEEIPAPSELRLTTRLNGELMQEADVSNLVFDIPTLVEYCSTFTELLPGDVIATGTPGGVGAARTPPVWLKPGDTVEVDIPGVGRLRSPVGEEHADAAP